MIEQHYKTPEGFVDYPFIWVFDARSLVNGTSPQNLIIPVKDADFYLRSAVGMATVASRWNYFNPSREPAIGQGVRSASALSDNLLTTSNRYTVVPEKFYPVDTEIRFDLQNVAKAVNEDDQEISFLGFQGVKRLAAGAWKFNPAQYRSDYRYYEKPWSYEVEVGINFFVDQGAAPRKFTRTIEEFDFELQKICIHRRDVEAEGGGGPVGSLGVDPFLMLMWDPTGYDKLSSDFCPARWYNFFETTGNFFSVMPVPTMIYPIGSQISFELLSLLVAAGGTQTYQFSFQGVQRIPC